VNLTVSDVGPGVPVEAVDRIFEPFYRLEEARDRESGGAGLGLAIVKSCVEACGGRVDCKNRAPRGLEVNLVFEAA
jgi:two-component system, OmpR family, sensor histidine kinase CpxA